MQAIKSTVDRTANAGPLETIMEDEEFSAAKSKGIVDFKHIFQLVGLLYTLLFFVQEYSMM